MLAPLFERLAALAKAEGAQHFVIMNVAEGPLLAVARGLGLEVSYMFDRFHLDLSGIHDFDALVARLPPAGRHEMRRQLRKFEASGARAVVETAPFARLDELAQLCHLTTARRGTPQYLPPAPLAQLVSSCGDMIRFVVIYDRDDRIVAGVICIDDGPILHVWLGGMTYEGLDFSPYTVCFAEAYRYALAQGKQRIEAGRLNAKIKHRLGLSPMPLHAIVSPDLRARTSADGRRAHDNNGSGRPSSVSCHEGAGQDQGGSRPLAGGGPGSAAGARRSRHRGPVHRHLRDGSAYPQLGPVGAKDRLTTDDHRPRVRGPRGGRGRECPRERGAGRGGDRGGAHRLRQVPSLRCAARAISARARRAWEFSATARSRSTSRCRPAMSGAIACRWIWSTRRSSIRSATPSTRR